MRKRKPGQAAIEYLTTYGWAILVVIVAIGALAYFGVIDVSKFIPRSMDFSGGLSPGQFKIDEGHFTFSVLNNFGYDINLLTYVVNSSSASDVTCYFAKDLYGTKLLNGGRYDFQVIGCSGEPKQRFKADIVIAYQKGGESVTHTILGSVQTIVEPGNESFCGDGIIQADRGEVCDRGFLNGVCPAACSLSCTGNDCAPPPPPPPPFP